MQTEMTGRLCCRPDDPLAVWLLRPDGELIGLSDVLGDWMGQPVRLIVADGHDRRWVLLETDRGGTGG